MTMNRIILALFVCMGVFCAQPSARAADNILVVNDCDHDIRMFIRYNPSGSKWRNKGWWVIHAGVNTYLSDNNTKIVHKKSEQLYAYAYTLNARYIWNSDKARINKTSFDGDTFYLRAMDDIATTGNLDTVIKFTCD